MLSLTSNIIISIALVPYLVGNLGVAVYGLIPLSMIFVEYMNLISQSLMTSINRYLSIAIQEKNKTEAKAIFSTSMYMMIFLALIQVIIFTWPLLNVDKIIEIGSIDSIDVVYLFYFVFLSYIVSLITSILNVSMYSKNRLDLIQFSNIIRVTSRSIFIVIFFCMIDVNLFYVGLATLLASFLSFIYSYINYRKITPSLKVDISYVDMKKIKILLSLGGWLIINQVGFLLLSRVDILLVNKLVGVNEAGEYAIVVQISNLIRSCLAVLSGLTGPIIFKLYAENKIKEAEQLTYTFSKLLSLISAIIVTFIIFNYSYLIELWLGAGFENLQALIYILIAPLIFNIGVTPLFTLNTAYGKVKIPGIMSLVFGMISILLGVYLVEHTNLGAMAIAICSILALTTKNALFMPLYSSYMLKVKWTRYFSIHVYSLLLVVFGLLIDYFFRELIINTSSENFIGLTIWLFVYVIVLSFIAWTMFGVSDKKIIKDFLIKKVKF